MANVTFNLRLIQAAADTDSADAVIDVKMDGTVVASAATISSTDINAPTEVSFTVNDFTEASHSMEIAFTNPYYVDYTDYREIKFLGGDIVTAYDTFKTGVQKDNQDALISRNYYPATENAREFRTTWSALTIDGDAVANSGDTTWNENSQNMYNGSMIITFAYANDGYNEYPYRNLLDADSTPPTLSNTMQIPWGSPVVRPPGRPDDIVGRQFADEE
jgi:hypothetical protein